MFVLLGFETPRCAGIVFSAGIRGNGLAGANPAPRILQRNLRGHNVGPPDQGRHLGRRADAGAPSQIHGTSGLAWRTQPCVSEQAPWACSGFGGRGFARRLFSVPVLTGVDSD